MREKAASSSRPSGEPHGESHCKDGDYSIDTITETLHTKSHSHNAGAKIQSTASLSRRQMNTYKQDTTNAGATLKGEGNK